MAGSFSACIGWCGCGIPNLGIPEIGIGNHRAARAARPAAVPFERNDQRKEPTVSERVALAEAIAERLQGRQLANLKQNREGNISHSDESGRTNDIAAAKAGLGSGKTLEAAKRVIERDIPELVEAMDNGKVSTRPAAVPFERNGRPESPFW